ncbi:biotin/lipoyl-containing protein [Marinitoga aeolica]|uniref:Biotin/lipoyl-binding protein n=1 Tax=Marinitoga aeolica TaxID=2809031 RepID=A0ABY8PS45_9BACT|nr:biotin/lipoyl-containing protein [Marinitoga aeolica]WGS65456.1 biotin/lipoyl-binding protein [Marinitoga aeolica]
MIRKFNVKVNGKTYEVEVEELGVETVSQPTQVQKPEPVHASVPTAPRAETPKTAAAPKPTPAATASVSSGKNVVKAPLPGVVVDINVAEGNRVSKGQKLLVIEAMKMENEILSDYDGVVEKILVKKGDNIDGDQELIIIS